MILLEKLRFDASEEYRKTIINNNHIPPTKKKIGASFKILIEKIFFVIGIRPVETKTKPET